MITLIDSKAIRAVSGGDISCKCGFTDATIGMTIQTSETRFPGTTATQEIKDRCKNSCCDASEDEPSGVLNWYSVNGQQKEYCHQRIVAQNLFSIIARMS
jgi:hypothetical protein